MMGCSNFVVPARIEYLLDFARAIFLHSVHGGGGDNIEVDNESSSVVWYW